MTFCRAEFTGYFSSLEKGTQDRKMSATATPNPNPRCPICNGTTQRRGTYKGAIIFKCQPCRKSVRRLPDGSKLVTQRSDTTPRPRCPHCHGPSKKDGVYPNGSQIYFCRSCDQRFSFGPLSQGQRPEHPPCPGCQGATIIGSRARNGTPCYYCRACCKGFVGESVNRRRIQSNPACSHCGGSSQKRGLSANGTHKYSCRDCKQWFFYSRQQQRQHEVRQQAEQLPALIEQKLPKSLPVEIREELQQELVMAALAGEFALSEIDQAVTLYRRKVYRQSLTGFGYVSLDAVIPHTEGLTIADTLIG